MSERESLLAAVIANPDDDLPRLIFADWLDENGEAKLAEFIRRQIELNKTIGAIKCMLAEIRRRAKA